jgi:hypothetical protein
MTYPVRRDDRAGLSYPGATQEPSHVPSMCRAPALRGGTARYQVGRHGASLPKDSGHLRAKVAFRNGFPEALVEGSIPGASTFHPLFPRVAMRLATPKAKPRLNHSA